MKRGLSESAEKTVTPVSEMAIWEMDEDIYFEVKNTIWSAHCCMIIWPHLKKKIRFTCKNIDMILTLKNKKYKIPRKWENSGSWLLLGTRYNFRIAIILLFFVEWVAIVKCENK